MEQEGEKVPVVVARTISTLSGKEKQGKGKGANPLLPMLKRKVGKGGGA